MCLVVYVDSFSSLEKKTREFQKKKPYYITISRSREPLGTLFWAKTIGLYRQFNVESRLFEFISNRVRTLHKSICWKPLWNISFLKIE